MQEVMIKLLVSMFERFLRLKRLLYKNCEKKNYCKIEEKKNYYHLDVLALQAGHISFEFFKRVFLIPELLLALLKSFLFEDVSSFLFDI